MDNITFQEEAVEQLLTQFKQLWKQPARQIPITLKAPTGSGKTYMTEKFICELSKQPDWHQDIAYIWITFSEELAMQSRDKFYSYFPTELPGRLLTIADLNQGALLPNDILFLNWQKLVSRKAEDRINRRPTDNRMRKESGYYFEDVLDLTHNNGCEFVLVIDESHRNFTEASIRDVIDPINPKIILKVSATPEAEPSASDLRNYRAGFWEVIRDDVIAAGLIKSQIVCQTEEDLRKYESEDLDKALMKMAMERRQIICDEIKKFDIDINPLVIIQLPNDDTDLVEAGEQTKEQYVTQFLQSQGVDEKRIAHWFADQKKPDGLEDNNSPYDYLLFKTAAGTGWDCPRAQILVMFREIHSPTFETQTIGRIVRVPVRNNQATEIFKTGYIYTNYKRSDVVNAEYGELGNKPKVFISENKLHKDFDIDPKLESEFMSRVDYGDLGKAWEFQQVLIKCFNEEFNIESTDSAEERTKKLQAKGLDINAPLLQDIIVGAKFENFDAIALELKNSKDSSFEVSSNDVQKIFSSFCVSLLKEQTDEDCKIGNIARSWSPLKRALRMWFRGVMPNNDEDFWYRVFIKDIYTGPRSVFRHCLVKTLKAYRPNLDKQIKEREEQSNKQETKVFCVQKMYAFSEDYDPFENEKCLFEPFYLRKEYDGRDNEIDFIKYIDTLPTVKWWMKNGDSGRDWLSIRYFNTVTNKTELFYPDWILKLTDGTVCIFDTKAGITATQTETKCKAEQLYKRIRYLNGFNREHIRYIGGITRKENGIWYLNNSAEYSCTLGSTEGWVELSKVLNP